MDKRIRDRIRRVEKIEVELLSDEELINEKKEILILVDAVQNELSRRMVLLAALIIAFSVSVVGLLSYPSAPMLAAALVFLIMFISSLMIYLQKNNLLEELYKSADLLSVENTH